MSIRKQNLAWAAGFVDGEGYFGGSPKSNGFALQFVVGQNGSPALLKKLKRILQQGRINGPYFVKGRKPNYRFCVYGLKIFLVAKLL